MSQSVTVVEHPLIAHKLSLARDKTTPSVQFRQLIREISLLVGYEVLRDLPTELREIETPVGSTTAPVLLGKKVVFVPVLRAGMGIVDGLLELVPSARVGHIGLFRDPDTLKAVEYYFKMPEGLSERLVVVCDPMLATGNCCCCCRLPAQGSRRARDQVALSARRPGGHRCISRATP